MYGLTLHPPRGHREGVPQGCHRPARTLGQGLLEVHPTARINRLGFHEDHTWNRKIIRVFGHNNMYAVL